MFIFEKNSKCYAFIHIPKNSGRYLKRQMSNDPNIRIIQANMDDASSNMHLAHIPYMKREKFIDPTVEYHYFAHSRNPYHRMISAFFFKNPTKNIMNFKEFVKNTLGLYDFSTEFNRDIVHYYPQYLFVCDENENITDVEVKQLEVFENPKKYILQKYFDNECIEIVNRIYKKDFELFGYDMIDIHTTSFD